MLLVATHTKTCRQTGEYTLLVRGSWSLSSVREGMAWSKDFPFRIQTQTHLVETLSESWISWSSGSQLINEVLIVECIAFIKQLGGWWTVNRPWITNNKRLVSQKHLETFCPVRVNALATFKCTRVTEPRCLHVCKVVNLQSIYV